LGIEFTSRQHPSALANLREILLGKLFDKLMRKCILASILYQLELLLGGRVFMFCTEQTVGNIVEHCPTEQHGFLLHKTDLRAKVSKVQVADVSAI
jgi:hypothetical protein